ncbi:NAD-dependent epimerase/dehydratase family protein [Seongchinamella sediminis]|uniref:NAD-dependent epimerase/dehydratase family protein n=2 Tax=Seongchinamella sediminis TaxID=2283635 RepID=A0A3L7DVQ3_9GAMM|nr:NAD-dependent epimerase/dehydratase family protein [Seongchinamella sediminis]
MRRLARFSAALLLSLLLAACASQQKLPPQQIAAAIAPVSQPTTIALLGGTGMVGGHILQQALARGYPLRVLARSPEKLAYLGERITVVAGDARDPDVIADLLDSAEVVISAIGPGKQAPADLTTAVSRNIVTAMRAQGINRYLVVSGAGVVTPDDRRDFIGWSIRQLARLRYPTLLRDRQREYALLAATDINWTIARCPLIESGAATAPAGAALRTPAGFRLQAGELAEFLLDQLADPTWFQRAPFVYSD